MKRSMANVCFFAVTGASLLSISLMTTVAEDEAELLKRAQELFQPLPKDMATPEFPDSSYQRARRSGAMKPVSALPSLSRVMSALDAAAKSV